MLVILLLLLFITIIIISRKKNHFTNYHDIPNFLVYNFGDNIYKYKGNKLIKINNYNIEHPIKINNVKKKNDLINISKECNKIYSSKEFKYKNCKNYCNFVDTKDKHNCLEKCEKYNTFSWNQCTKFFQKLIYNIK